MSKPDLTCSIEAFGPEGAAIADRGAVVYQPEGVARVTFRATNQSDMRSGQFWLRPCVQVNGARVYDPPVEMMSLEAGESWTDEFTRPFGGPEETWEASILVDINDFVDESDERNNRATFSFTARPSAS